MISPQFIQNCQAGDEQAIETLVRAHQRTVFQLALSVLDDALVYEGNIPDEVLQEAEVATRETFIAALDRLGRYREDTPFEAWLYGVAIQVSRRRYRRWKLRRFLMRLIGRSNPAFLKGSDRKSATGPAEPRLQPGDAALWSAVRALPQSLRLPVVLRYYHELSIADIARVLHSSEGGVHARLDAARERIARELEA